MFGMLDYRAHKLFLLLFGLPLIALSLFGMFGLGFIAYLIGFSFVETWAIKVVLSIVSMVVIQLLWDLFALAIGKIFEFIFWLFVDLIPADGRTNFEAQVVVVNGEKGITALKTSQDPKLWTDEDIQKLSKLDWIEHLFFGDRIVSRCRQVREHFTENPDIEYTEWRLKEFVDNSNVPFIWQEKVFSSKANRKLIIAYSVFVVLILVNPLNI